MILTCEQLLEVEQKPTVNSISLDLLREFYEKYLNPYNYTYKAYMDENYREITVRFEKKRFCHLLSIEKIVARAVPYWNLDNFKGDNGWEKIVLGDLTIGSIKTLNKRGFNDNKLKYVYFYLLPRLLENPKGIKFDPSKVEGGTLVPCEILFYDEYENAYVHIGIDKEDDTDFYFPRTFLVEKINKEKDGKRFIKDQTEITVKKELKNLVQV